MMSGKHHCDGNPTMDVGASMGVELLTLGGEATGQAFHRDLCLDGQKAIQRDN